MLFSYIYFLLISGFTTFLFFLNCKQTEQIFEFRTRTCSSLDWLCYHCLGRCFSAVFFQGDFRFYMDSNADVRRKVEEFLGFGEGLNGKWMVSNFIIFVYLYIYTYIYTYMMYVEYVYVYI